jgi:proline iminopeptidase
MYTQVNGARIFFDVDGEGLSPRGSGMVERPTIFILHGGPGSDHSYFKPWLRSLTGIAQLVYMDHRGNGRSELTGPSTYNLEQMADDIEGLRLTLGCGPIIVLGHSFGGMVALTYVLKYQASVRAALFCNTSASRRFRDDAWEFVKRIATPEQMAMLPRLFDGKLESLEEYSVWWHTCMPLYFREGGDKDLVDQLVDRERGQIDVVNHMMAHELPNYDVVDKLGTITVPSLVVAGRHDWVTTVPQLKTIADGIPGSELIVYERTGHFPFIEEQDQFLDDVRSFILGTGI